MSEKGVNEHTESIAESAWRPSARRPRMEEEEEADRSAASANEPLCYRQRAEKSTGGEMVLMAWSPTMDVLASAFADRSVGCYWNGVCHFVQCQS